MKNSNIQFRTQWNQIPVKKKTCEINTEESQTVQGETYSIKQLMLRAVAQGQIPQAPDGHYLDVPIDEINALYKRGIDLTDLDELSNQVKILTNNIEEQKQLANQAKLALELEAKIQARTTKANVEQPKETDAETIVPSS